MPRRLSTAVAPLLGAAAVVVLAGCGSSRVDVARRGEPALVEIHTAFADAVAWAATQPGGGWSHGWFGNASANASESVHGLCHEWQALVWDGTRSTVERLGWRADGIAINAGTFSAHHAVVVWDPVRIDRGDLLAAPPEAPAFVLDAWRRGEPDVYTVAGWIDVPILVMEPPELEDLLSELGTEPRFGPLAAPR